MLGFIKYSPQIWMNYKRQSTEGLNITFFILDLMGGLFCVFQQFIDMYIVVLKTGDWNQFSMFSDSFNIIKFGIAMLTLSFDLMIAFQHFVLYPKTPFPEILTSGLLMDYDNEETMDKEYKKFDIDDEERHYSVSDLSTIMPRGQSLLSKYDRLY